MPFWCRTSLPFREEPLENLLRPEYLQLFCPSIVRMNGRVRENMNQSYLTLLHENMFLHKKVSKGFPPPRSLMVDPLVDCVSHFYFFLSSQLSQGLIQKIGAGGGGGATRSQGKLTPPPTHQTGTFLPRFEGHLVQNLGTLPELGLGGGDGPSGSPMDQPPKLVVINQMKTPDL